MQTVIVLCGGESGEHEVSLRSANSIINHIAKEKYKVIPVGIDKTGKWVTGSSLFQNPDDPEKIALAPNLEPAELKDGSLNGTKIDAIFPIVHGTYGEDGALQGYLQLQHVPYVGPEVLGSAVGMDKDIMKKLLLFEGINTAKHRVFYRHQKEIPGYDILSRELGEVLFVKPCNLGSSIGISRCSNAEELEQAISLAFQYDRKILVEQEVKGREIEVAVLGNEDPKASIPGEIIPGETFYSYDSKYINSDATKLEIPAKFDPEQTEQIRETAVRVFQLLELAGLTRVDFFVEESGKIWVNEVNTLPGFTSISMYPKLWEATGIPYPELIDRLIQLGIERFEENRQLIRSRK